MLRAACSVAPALLALALPAAAGAAVRLADRTTPVHALAAGARDALAVVDSGDASRPFALVRSTGRGRDPSGRFGVAAAEFPAIAVTPGGESLAAWARPISGGSLLEATDPVSKATERTALGTATGPPRLAVAGAAALVAFPDRNGDVAVVEWSLRGRGGEPGAVRTLTSSGPHRRHLPLDAGTGPEGDPLVLDLVQTRTSTELRVVGPGAPAAPLAAAPRLQTLHAAMAAAGGRVAVAYVSRGRAVLAVPAGSNWRRRRLPGRGGAMSPPAVVLAGGAVLVAYEQLVRDPRHGRRRQRDIHLARVAGGSVSVRRITRSPGHDRSPLAAVARSGAVYLAWSRRDRGVRGPVALLERVR